MAFTIGQSDDSPTLWFTRMIGTIDESGSDNEKHSHDVNGGITHRSS